MPFKIFINQRAQEEIQNAFEYYEEQQIGLGEKFLMALKNGIEYLTLNPFHQLKYKDYRTLRISKFPYLIVYFIKGQNIYVAAIFHGSQNQKKLPK